MSLKVVTAAIPPVRHEDGGQVIVKGEGGSRTSPNAREDVSIMGPVPLRRLLAPNTLNELLFPNVKT